MSRSITLSSSYRELGIVLSGSKVVKKILPDPKDMRAVKEMLNFLKKRFKRNKNNVFVSNEFFALLLWENNPQKEWLFVTDSIPALHDQYINTVTKIISKKHPDFKFRFKLNTSLIDKKHSTILK